MQFSHRALLPAVARSRSSATAASARMRRSSTWRSQSDDLLACSTAIPARRIGLLLFATLSTVTDCIDAQHACPVAAAVALLAAATPVCSMLNPEERQQIDPCTNPDLCNTSAAQEIHPGAVRGGHRQRGSSGRALSAAGYRLACSAMLCFLPVVPTIYSEVTNSSSSLTQRSRCSISHWRDRGMCGTW